MLDLYKGLQNMYSDSGESKPPKKGIDKLFQAQLKQAQDAHEKMNLSRLYEGHMPDERGALLQRVYEGEIQLSSIISDVRLRTTHPYETEAIKQQVPPGMENHPLMNQAPTMQIPLIFNPDFQKEIKSYEELAGLDTIESYRSLHQESIARSYIKFAPLHIGLSVSGFVAGYMFKKDLSKLARAGIGLGGLQVGSRVSRFIRETVTGRSIHNSGKELIERLTFIDDALTYSRLQ